MLCFRHLRYRYTTSWSRTFEFDIGLLQVYAGLIKHRGMDEIEAGFTLDKNARNYF